MEPHGKPRRAYLSFSTFVGTGLSWLYCMGRIEAIGRRWDVILSMWVGRDQQLRPEVQVVGCCQDLW